MFNENDFISFYTKGDALKDGQQILMPYDIREKYGILFDTYITDSVVNIIDIKFDDLNSGIENLAGAFVLEVKRMKAHEAYIKFNFCNHVIWGYIGEEYAVKGPVITLMCECDM